MNMLQVKSAVEDSSRLDPGIEFSIDRLLLQRTEAYDGRAAYIQLLSKQSIQASEDVLVELQERARNFLRSKREVLLVLGDSGAGKSTFGMRLENELWNGYKPGMPLPLFIDLKTASSADIIHQHLDELDLFTDEQIENLRLSRQFVLICDGYDEFHRWTNLHTKNQFNKPRQWQAKMIISCRTQYLGPNYRNYFEPEMPSTANPNFSHSSDLFEEAVIVPFRSTQIQEYVELFAQTPRSTERLRNGLDWSTEQYMRRLKSIMHLMELAKNPFMLKMILDVLPSIAKTTTKMTRVELYDRFVELHFKSEQQRLSNQQYSGKMDNETLSAFSALKDDELIDLGLDFSKQLSLNIFKKQKGLNSVTYSVILDGGSWKDEFFGSDVRAKLLRQSAQLVCRENKEDPRLLIRHRIRPSRKRSSYEFSHRSMLEYFYSCLIFDPRGNVPQLNLAACLDSTESPSPVVEHPLGQINIVSESSIILFLAERVQQNEELRDQLHTILQLSRTEEETSQAATNAITILVQARESFSDVDLKDIRVPGADLSCGEFDSAQLQGADLRNTILRNAWMHQADLSGSQMEGVMFGEFPYLDMGNPVQHCAFSRDGKYLAVGLRNGKIVMYDTLTWSKIPFRKHTGGVTSLTYSPSGGQIASGGLKNTIRLWDIRTGALTTSLVGHSDSVVSVAYSPIGHQIASGSDDNTVRLWDTETGALTFSLSGHTDGVISVAYSHSGNQVASGSFDRTIRLWDSQTGALTTSLSGHTDAVSTVTYSPSGHQIASGSDDKSVRLWDAETGAFTLSLGGHKASVFAVVYSPSGHQIASGSEDKTVRLWDAKTGALTSSLSGHTDAIIAVAYSLNGHQIASGSYDRTVRLWNAKAGALLHSFSGHTDSVSSVAYSPTGHQIASGSWDHSIRLWDAKTGTIVSSFSGHSDAVSSVAYSPRGHQIASCGDGNTVRLWDTHTGTITTVLSGHVAGVTSVSYSPDGRLIASSSYDETVQLWDAISGAPILSLIGHEGAVAVAVFSPSGHQIASGGYDHTVRLWDALTGAFISSLSGHTDAIISAVYSPSGHQIASSSFDHTVRLWDPQTGVPTISLSGHTKAVKSVAYSPSGHRIASGSDDYSLRIWEPDSGQCLFILNGFQDAALSIVWRATLDGVYLAVGGRSDSVRRWKVVEDKNKRVQMRLCWQSTPDTLVLAKVCIQGVQGLSEANSRLLQQRATCHLSFD